MNCKHEYKDADEYDGERWCIHCYEPWFISRITELQAALIKIRDARGIFETNGLRRIARDALLKGGKHE